MPLLNVINQSIDDDDAPMVRVVYFRKKISQVFDRRHGLSKKKIRKNIVQC